MFYKRKVIMKTSVEMHKEADNLYTQANNIRNEAIKLEKLEAEQRLKNNTTIPVDRSDIQLSIDGSVPLDKSHTEILPSGMQKDYVILSEKERTKGFVRPFRDAYRHLKCSKITTMSRAIAETYARDPYFYSGTFCSSCKAHFSVGEDGEFTWYEMDGSEGPKVGK